jgi:hypothetical protein
MAPPKGKRAKPNKPRAHKPEARSERGFPTLLTAELAGALVRRCRHTRDFRKAIAIGEGVHPKTLELWLAKGLSEGAEEPYRGFAERFLRAEAALREELIRDLLESHSMAHVSALTWFIERRFRDFRRDAETNGGEALDVIQDLTPEAAPKLTAEGAAALVPRLLDNPQIRRLLEQHGCTLPETT